MRSLRELLPECEFLAPDIPVDPAEALPFQRDFCKWEQPNVIVGTSMGGMYAQQMRGFKRICVNPAFDLSTHKDILREGTFEFFTPPKGWKEDIFHHAGHYSTFRRDGGASVRRHHGWRQGVRLWPLRGQRYDHQLRACFPAALHKRHPFPLRASARPYDNPTGCRTLSS